MQAELLGVFSINWTNWANWSRCPSVFRGQNGVTKNKTTISYSNRVQITDAIRRLAASVEPRLIECIPWLLLASSSSVLCCALAVGAGATVGGVADSVVAVILGLMIGAKYADRLD